MTAQPMVQPTIVPGTLVNTILVGTIMQIAGGKKKNLEYLSISKLCQYY